MSASHAMDEHRDKVAGLIGKTIERIEVWGHDQDSYLRLVFTDGSVLEVEGVGYDGLWDQVYCTVQEAETRATA